MGKILGTVLVVGGSLIIGGLAYPLFHPEELSSEPRERSLSDAIIEQFNGSFESQLGYKLTEGVIGEVKAGSYGTDSKDQIPNVKVIMLTKGVKDNKEDLYFLRAVFPNGDGSLCDEKSENWNYSEVCDNILNKYSEIADDVSYELQPTTAEVLYTMDEVSRQVSAITAPLADKGETQSAVISGCFIVSDGNGFRCEIESTVFSKYNAGSGLTVSGKSVGEGEDVGFYTNNTVSVELPEKVVYDPSALNDALIQILQNLPEGSKVSSQRDKFNGESAKGAEQYSQLLPDSLERQPE